jgi:ABC-type dipeptide/oligopeptide/nickel transport system permease component
MSEARILRYIIRRIIRLVPLFFLIIIFAFILIHSAPGDPISILAGEQADPAYYEMMRKKFGLDRPIYEQLLAYILAILRGDLGYSFIYNVNVLDLVLQRLRNTMLLIAGATLIYIPLGVGLGVLSSIKPRTVWDTLITSFTLIGYSLPIWWLGIILLQFLALWLGWFPVYSGLAETPSGFIAMLGIMLRNLTLPSITLATAYMALTARLTRSSMMETLTKDFIITAQAKGLSKRQVLISHALRNSLLPVISLIFLNLGYMFGGAVLTETVFSWPGIGLLMVDAVRTRDYPVVMGVFILISFAVLLINLITDIVYCIIDPRVRLK